MLTLLLIILLIILFRLIHLTLITIIIDVCVIDNKWFDIDNFLTSLLIITHLQCLEIYCVSNFIKDYLIVTNTHLVDMRLWLPPVS
jgi:hypothetical protein